MVQSIMLVAITYFLLAVWLGLIVAIITLLIIRGAKSVLKTIGTLLRGTDGST